LQYKLNKLALGTLAIGHMAVDMQTSSLAVMIPLLYVTYNLDYGSAALIITLNSLTSSFTQPLFGIISDKKPLRWLLPSGVLLASGGTVLVLFMPSYWLVLLVVIISGLGSAAYHPEGSRNANYVSGPVKATGVSVFFVGGNLGFTIGPILTTLLIAIFGFSGVFVLLIPASIAAFLLWRLLPLYAEYSVLAKNQPATSRKKASYEVKGRRGLVGIMTLLLSIISFRSVIQTGMVTFIPLYLLTLPGGSKEEAAFLLAVFLFAGAIGTLIGGRLADRLGSKNVMAGSMLITCPALLIFLNTSGIIQLVAIAIAGAALISASSLTVVMAQAIMPKSIGLASGLTLGLGFGAGGLGAAALGKYADWFGIGQTMVIIAFLPLAILALSLFMPTAKPSTPTPQAVPVAEMASPSGE